ncbi:hypothetical protein [Lactiplantibacillus plantarum]|uniref:hypothetical protein n=1 Tax=Lactiplantibacillus plantarum TaxID=1590 RepID=UPI001B8116D1|nr:hypothetical protein [Lactiplantibacillus plantarum]GIQ95196.1 hypothetical protein COY2906_20660 [Lactiplantibacillus plantarum]
MSVKNKIGFGMILCVSAVVSLSGFMAIISKFGAISIVLVTLALVLGAMLVCRED